jgi:hypothetical protein
MDATKSASFHRHVGPCHRPAVLPFAADLPATRVGLPFLFATPPHSTAKLVPPSVAIVLVLWAVRPPGICIIVSLGGSGSIACKVAIAAADGILALL